MPVCCWVLPRWKHRLVTVTDSGGLSCPRFHEGVSTAKDRWSQQKGLVEKVTLLRSLNSSATNGLHDIGTVTFKILGFCQCRQNVILSNLPSLQPHHSQHTTSFAYTLVDATIAYLRKIPFLFVRETQFFRYWRTSWFRRSFSPPEPQGINLDWSKPIIVILAPFLGIALEYACDQFWPMRINGNYAVSFGEVSPCC